MKNEKIKEPKFTGIREGYAAVWIAEPLVFIEDASKYHSRIRFLTSEKIIIYGAKEANSYWNYETGEFTGDNKYSYALEGIPYDLFSPCWEQEYVYNKKTKKLLTRSQIVRKQIKDMYAYDNSASPKRKTTFLGYVKDTE